MKFDLSALKAWMASVLTGVASASSTESGAGAAVIGIIEKLTGFDIPPNGEVIVAGAVGWLIGYVAVYMTSNELGKTA